MVTIIPMATDALVQTKAYMAFQELLTSKNDPNKTFMHLMWRSKKALDNTTSIGSDLFSSHRFNLVEEARKNPEFHASIHCTHLLLDNIDEPFMAPDKQYLSNEKNPRLLSPVEYATDLETKYPDLGQYFKNNLSAYSYTLLQKNILKQQADERNRQQAVVESFAANTPDATQLPIAQQLSQETWDKINENDSQPVFTKELKENASSPALNVNKRRKDVPITHSNPAYSNIIRQRRFESR